MRNTLPCLHSHFSSAIRAGQGSRTACNTPVLHNAGELFLPRVSPSQIECCVSVFASPSPSCRICERQGWDLGEFLAPFDLAALGDEARSEDCKHFLRSACLEPRRDQPLPLNMLISFCPSQETWRHEKTHSTSYSKYFILRGWEVVWVSFVYFLFLGTLK